MFKKASAICLLIILFPLLNACVATAVGVAVGTTVAVGKAVVKAPIKVGGAVVDVMTEDEQEQFDREQRELRKRQEEQKQ